MSAAVESVEPLVAGPVRVGSIIDGNYKVLRILGRGGMGMVYEAEHLRLGVPVALKVLRGAADERSARRLLREASLTARLNTDHIVRVNDCGTLADGLPYVVMERLHGEDLRSLLEREGQLTVQAALRIAREICAGLADLHAIGIVHRDIKPANVFVLNADLSRCRCKLIDLGIARGCNADTSSPVVLGSIRYMAPEQLVDNDGAQVQSDVYALGVILYQCLTGKLPHQGETAEEIAFSILNRRARPVSELRSEVSPALSKLIMSAIGRNPSARPPSAVEFARSLAAFSVAIPGHASDSLSEGTTRAVLPEAPRRSSRALTFVLAPIALCAVGLLLPRFRAPAVSVESSPPLASALEVHAVAPPTHAPAPTSVASASPPPVALVTHPPLAPLPQPAESARQRGRDSAAKVPATRKDSGAPAAKSVKSTVTELGLDANPFRE